MRRHGCARDRRGVRVQRPVRNSYCQGLKNSSCGTCQAPSSHGASCSSSSCWQGPTCVGATMMCAADGVLNGSCDDGDPSGYGLTCVGAVASTSTPGTCQAVDNVLVRGAPAPANENGRVLRREWLGGPAQLLPPYAA
ncbi:MAG TPA: hypothetical protein VLC06_14630 [Polyangia bacterium]|nr:hypothetical protein [Polyangia bacterium]